MSKKLIQINTVCNNSTGRIMRDIQREAMQDGYETLSLVGRRKPFCDLPCEKVGNGISFWIHVVITTLFDKQGYGSYFHTKKLVKRLREESPDIIHLHNLHGYYLNLPILFQYLSNEFKGQVFWTFHDCWPITGHCAHFISEQCMRWKTGCHHCPKKKEYPISLLLDSSDKNYKDKKRMFTGLNNLTVIVPSNWMAGWVKVSFLSNAQIEVVKNGINLESYRYTRDERILEKYNISKSKKILLGVSSVWSKRKGLEDFIKLQKNLPEQYQIVLIGLTKRQISQLPHGMIGIQRTEEIQELAVLYSSAFAFLNPSVEESFSLVTVEAMACGTPVIVLDTSAVQELVCEKNGIVLHNHDSNDYLKALQKLDDMQLERAIIRETALQYDVVKAGKSIIQLYSKYES